MCLQEHVIAIGHKDGMLTLYDCLRTEVIKSTQVAKDAILSLKFLHKQSHVVVNTAAGGMIVQLAALAKVIHSWPAKKKFAAGLLAVAPTDQHTLECSGGSFAVRSLET